MGKNKSGLLLLLLLLGAGAFFLFRLDKKDSMIISSDNRFRVNGIDSDIIVDGDNYREMWAFIIPVVGPFPAGYSVTRCIASDVLGYVLPLPPDIRLVDFRDGDKTPGLNIIGFQDNVFNDGGITS
ncbi:MAG: hypothetical protein Q8O68_00530 [Candidatus Daviesbacteria bacterium]|nr:hypothetical protein [Candidatus Daviesbacteria bacterium]